MLMPWIQVKETNEQKKMPGNCGGSSAAPGLILRGVTYHHLGS